jgi:NADPH:quinone reductase-like Zn-dependent oxidoreductase
MRKIIQNSFGPPEVLELVQDAPMPVAGPGETLVEVRGAGVNPIDTKVRAGRDILGPPPFTVGWDISGVVVESDVFEPGDEVFGLVSFPKQAAAYAEYAAVPTDHIVLKPPTITHDEAAAIPLAGETAWQALVHEANVQEGDRVLIHAGAGGVGHLAIQIAKALGAYVITTASEAKHGFVYAHGADEAIDYRTQDFAAELSDLDVVFDAVGGGTAAASIPTLKPGGRLVTIVDYRDESLPAACEAAGVEYHGFLCRPNADDLVELVGLIQAHKLRVEIAAVISMEAAAKAHELIETGATTGKIVLAP